MEGQNSFFFYIVENKIQLYIYVFELNKATYYLKWPERYITSLSSIIHRME